MRSLPRFRSGLGLFLVGTLVLSAASTSRIETLGDGTYAVTRTATNGFDRDVTKFRREAEADAAKFCAEKGRQMKLVAVSTDRPHFGGGFSSARIVFKALESGDPALRAPEAPPAPAAAAPTGTLPTYNGDTYSELLKLDDLRKRGILSDREFEQQKKKLLKNWK